MDVPAENPADSPLPEKEDGSAVPKSSGRWRHLLHAYGGPVLALVAVLAASYLFYLQIREHSPAEIWEKAKEIPLRRYVQALGLIGVHYIIFAVYEQVGLIYLKTPLSLPRLTLGSFVAYSLTMNLGWVIGGPMGRYQLYKAWGISPVEMVKLMAMLGMTYSVGVHAIPGIFSLWEPLDVPPKIVHEYHLFFDNTRWLGVLFLIVGAVYLLLCATRRGTLRILGFELQFPPLWLAACHMALCGADLVVMATTLRALMPPEVQVDYAHFLNVVMFTMIIVYFSHAPGGVGVFELCILKFLAEYKDPGIPAAIIMFRVLYFVLPLVVSLAILGAFAVARRIDLSKD
jgi:phosphatidylglycerol lysyltransferase